MRTNLVGLMGVVAMVGTAACNTVEPNAKITPFQDAKNPDEVSNTPIVYPAAPYGTAIGDTAPNYKFYGWHNPQISADVNNLEDISLDQFYNPSGTDTWPTDGTYRAGQAKPKLVWVDISAQWCGPCNQESKSDLPGYYAKYQPMGAEIILELIEDNNGNAALPTNLHMWTTAYKTAWPAIIDPSRQMFNLAEIDAYPENILIDTRTMKIIYKFGGVPTPGDAAGDAFFKKIESTLAN